jgi:hypothetical protein
VKLCGFEEGGFVALGRRWRVEAQEEQLEHLERREEEPIGQQKGGYKTGICFSLGGGQSSENEGARVVKGAGGSGRGDGPGYWAKVMRWMIL